MTSHDVVAIVRRATGEKSIGHLGTLDPMATGVLPLLLGRYTRLAQFFGQSDKFYEGRIRFGFATDTFDAEGDATTPAQPLTHSLEELKHTRRTLPRRNRSGSACLFGKEDKRCSSAQTGALRRRRSCESCPHHHLRPSAPRPGRRRSDIHDEGLRRRLRTLRRARTRPAQPGVGRTSARFAARRQAHLHSSRQSQSTS